MIPQALGQAGWVGGQLGLLWKKNIENPLDPSIPGQLTWLEKLAEKARQNEPSTAFSILGGIAALRNDSETMRHHYEDAIRHTEGNPMVRLNYGICLRYCGAHALAYEQHLLAVGLNNTDPLFLGALLGSCMGAGRFQEAFNCLGDLQRLKADVPLSLCENLEKITALLRQTHLSDTEVGAALSPVDTLLWQSKVPVKGVVAEIFHEDGEPWVGLCFNLLCSVERAADLEWEMCGRLSGGSNAQGDADPLRWIVPELSGEWLEDER